MTRLHIRITPRAAGQIERAARWWRKHRDKAPSAFHDDLEEAFSVIGSNPQIGEPVAARRRNIRRYWLNRIGYFLYYSEPEEDTIVIHTLWHASRGPRPRL